MVDATTDVEHSVNLVFLAVTAAIAWHGIRYRDADGNPDTVRLLFGCIAATFFFLVLFQDVLGLVRF
jgi:hypothetical protein